MYHAGGNCRGAADYASRQYGGGGGASSADDECGRTSANNDGQAGRDHAATRSKGMMPKLGGEESADEKDGEKSATGPMGNCSALRRVYESWKLRRKALCRLGSS
ncbi:unnamed protein product [Linum trigynum]|uniref:Uncharacterized protein n=1 Tax=Linum trigynum TaxID=586398 RepID=A0AAV2FM73_9ROSI